MNYEHASTPDHPSLQTLSLLASGDLPFITRAKLARHVRRCPLCDQQIAQFRSAKTELKREASAQALTGFEAIADWDRLEREMLGNIAVGVAAARCVDKVRRGRVFLWRGAFLAAMVALFAAGWATHIPRQQTDHVTTALRRMVGLDHQETTSGTVVHTTPEGIAVRSQGTTLTILHPPSAVVTLSGGSAVEARYVDEESGQVTITNVYGQ